MTNLIDRVIAGISQHESTAGKRRRGGPLAEEDYWAFHEVELVKLGRATQHLMSFRMLSVPDAVLTQTARLVWRRAWRCMRIKRRLDGMRTGGPRLATPGGVESERADWDRLNEGDRFE